jgi:hypothetical protein
MTIMSIKIFFIISISYDYIYCSQILCIIINKSYTKWDKLLFFLLYLGSGSVKHS